ncbi:MAG: lysylphosphatidylglycerol synthase domain-containing protein, partial [Chloroflexota bacterium]
LLILWSILIWIPVIIAYDLGLRAVHLQIPFALVAFTVCVAAFGVAAPSSPGQFGIFHASILFALTTVLNSPGPAVLSFAILYHTLQFILFILIGAIGLFMTGTSWRELLNSAQRKQSTPV